MNNEQKRFPVILAGRIPSKKNSKQIVFVHGRKLVIPSKEYAAWHKEQSKALIETKAYFCRGPQFPLKEATIEMIITFPDNRKADLTNKAESIMDLLVDNGILEDDNHKVCRRVVMESGGVDKLKAGANITIEYKV
jgi:hypothetical protein